MRTCLIGIALCFTSPLFAQTDSTVIRVIKDARIDSLIKKQIEINEFTTRDARRIVQGYRILVMNTQDRQEALQAKSVIYQQFPELTPYLVYQAPYFKVKVGNFLTSEEAENIVPSVKQVFPKGVFVVKDLVEINPDKAASLNQP
jgi:hypothetical protein